MSDRSCITCLNRCWGSHGILVCRFRHDTDHGRGCEWWEEKKAPSPSDPVNHPDHYTHTGITCAHCGREVEAIRITQAFMGNVSAAMKYELRAGKKTDDPIQDLRKAIRFLEFEVARLEEGRK